MGRRRSRAVRYGAGDDLAGIAFDAARTRAGATSERPRACPSRRASLGLLRARDREGDRPSRRRRVHQRHGRGGAPLRGRRGIDGARDAGALDRRSAARASRRGREPDDRPGRAVRRVRARVDRRARPGRCGRRADVARRGPRAHAGVDGSAAGPRAPEPAVPRAVGGYATGLPRLAALGHRLHPVGRPRTRGDRRARTRVHLHDGWGDPRGLDAGVAADACPNLRSAPGGRSSPNPPRTSASRARSRRVRSSSPTRTSPTNTFPRSWCSSARRLRRGLRSSSSAGRAGSSSSTRTISLPIPTARPPGPSTPSRQASCPTCWRDPRALGRARGSGPGPLGTGARAPPSMRRSTGGTSRSKAGSPATSQPRYPMVACWSSGRACRYATSTPT